MRLWLAMALVAGSATYAATVPLDVTDEGAPHFVAFTSQDGLSDEIWAAIDVDSRGFVWAGSASQLARFDGYRWVLWPSPDAHSLVRDIDPDPEGNLWATFEREGLARLEGDRWVLVDPDRSFVTYFVQSTDLAGRKRLLVARPDGLWSIEGGKLVPFLGTDAATGAIPREVVYTRTLFGGPRQWIGADRGLYWRTVVNGEPQGPWNPYPIPGEGVYGFTRVLATEERGREELWMLGFGVGIARLREDGLKLWRARPGELPTESIYSMRATKGPQGERWLWVATRAGLLRFRGDEMRVFDRRHGLPSDAVRNVEVVTGVDGEEILWLGTEGGVARAVLGRSQWRTVSLLGQSENGISGILLEDDDRGRERLWVGSMREGLMLLEEGRWRSFSAGRGNAPSDGVRQILRLPGKDGRPWRLLSTLGAGVYEIGENATFRRLPGPWDDVPDDLVNKALGRRFEGELEYWFTSAKSGIHRLRAGRFTSYRPFGSQEPAMVLQIQEQIDASGRSWIWAASAAGLLRYDNREWTLLPASIGLPADGYRSLALIEQEGRTVLWAGSNRHGVVRLVVDDPLTPIPLPQSDLPPPPDPTIYTLLADSRGRIYICTNNGVQQLTPVAHGFAERVFRRRDGLVHDECNTNSQQIDSLDRYWVGTLGGLSVFDPRIDVPSRAGRPKPLFLTELRVDGQALPFGDAPLEISAGVRELQLHYTLLADQREAESRYRTQLVGYDAEPLDWTADRVRSFTGLPPRTYEFHVEGKDFTGAKSGASVLRFRVLPHWWQRRPVQWLFGLSIPMLGAIGVALYNRNLRLRQQILEREVAARTAELDVANHRLTELSYQDALTGVANRRRFFEALEAAVTWSRERQQPLGLIVVDVDHFKAYNDRWGHLVGDVALQAVARSLEGSRRPQDLVARYGGEEFACLLVDADAVAVKAVAERMRAAVQALPPRTLGNHEQSVTLSAGVWSGIPSPDLAPADLLERADAALFAAKRAGRNRIRSA